MPHTEHTPAWILAGEQVGRANARDALALFRSEGMPLTWTGIEIDDGDVLLSAGLEPDTPQWEAAESAARDEFYRCTSQWRGDDPREMDSWLMRLACMPTNVRRGT